MMRVVSLGIHLDDAEVMRMADEAGDEKNERTLQGKLVLIEWIDSHAGRGWRDYGTFQTVAEPMFCQSVGWLAIDRADCKVIVPHLGGEERGDRRLQGCGDITIPTIAIKKITVLRND